MVRRTRRPRPRAKNLAEWADQYPEARVTRRELVRILNAVVAHLLPEDAVPAVPERDGEAGTPEGGA